MARIDNMASNLGSKYTTYITNLRSTNGPYNGMSDGDFYKILYNRAASLFGKDIVASNPSLVSKYQSSTAILTNDPNETLSLTCSTILA